MLNNMFRIFLYWSNKIKKNYLFIHLFRIYFMNGIFSIRPMYTKTGQAPRYRSNNENHEICMSVSSLA